MASRKLGDACDSFWVMSKSERLSPVQGNENSGNEGRGSFFRPKSVGRSVGRKFGVLYDEYVKYKVLSA